MQTPLNPGDIILCDGGAHGDLVDVITHTLPNGIQVVSHSYWTHSMMVWPPDVPIAGAPQEELHVIESTILRGKNGPQINALAARVHDYEPDGAIVALHLSERIRAFLDWGAMWAEAARRLDHDRYNVGELLAYLLRHFPGIQEIPALYRSDEDSEVCSELMAILLRAGGLPGFRPACMPPQALLELGIYSGYTFLLGERPMKGFNSR